MTTPQNRPRIEFDAWVSLARENPQAFEKKRIYALNQAILEAPPRLQHRLRCLQWKLDRIRETSANPLAASIQMQQLLWDYLTGPRGLLARLQGMVSPAMVEQSASSTAKILEFHR
jgi:hypothetical protein